MLDDLFQPRSLEVLKNIKEYLVSDNEELHASKYQGYVQHYCYKCSRPNRT